MRKSLFILMFLSSVFSILCGQEKGNATYYSQRLKGFRTSDGSRYHPDSLTCAHRTYPLGTYLLVRNPKNSQQVVVKVTDRGPFQKRLLIDVSYSAAKTLDIIRMGIAPVEVYPLDFIPLSFSQLPIPYVHLQVGKIDVLEIITNKLFPRLKFNLK